MIVSQAWTKLPPFEVENLSFSSSLVFCFVFSLSAQAITSFPQSVLEAIIFDLG